MPSTTASPANGAAVVDEAAETMADASRRATESAKAATEITSTYLNDSTQAGRKMFSAWTTGTESAFKASSELQSTLLKSALSLIETNARSSRSMLEQWSAASRETQQAWTELFQASATAAERLARIPSSTLPPSR